MEPLLRALTWLRWRLFPPLFAIEVVDGTARARSGDVPGELVRGFSDVADDLGLVSGTIYGVRGGHGLTLGFSSEIPGSAHQRLRNVLALHRHRFPGG